MTSISGYPCNGSAESHGLRAQFGKTQELLYNVFGELVCLAGKLKSSQLLLFEEDWLTTSRARRGNFAKRSNRDQDAQSRRQSA